MHLTLHASQTEPLNFCSTFWMKMERSIISRARALSSCFAEGAGAASLA